jgi:hypothetical protein
MLSVGLGSDFREKPHADSVQTDFISKSWGLAMRVMHGLRQWQIDSPNGVGLFNIILTWRQ